MPTYQVTDPTTNRVLKLTGDSPPTEDELEQIFAQQETPEISPAKDSIDPIGRVVPSSAQGTEKPEGSMFHAIAEPALAIGSGLVGTIGGGLAGLGTAAVSGPEEGAKTVRSVQEAATEFGTPETKRGEEALETLGDIMQKGIDLANIPLSGLAGLNALIAGKGIDEATRLIKEVQEKGFTKASSDEAFRITGDPLMATVAGVYPDVVAAAIPVTKFTKTNTALKAKIADKIKAGSTDKAIAKYILDGSGKVKTDAVAREAIKQGFDQSIIATAKGASSVDKAKMAKMVDIMKKGKENALFAMKNRPANVAGDSLLDRVKHIKTVNRDAGKQLDSVAKSLKGKKVDFDQPINNFIDNLDEMGITLDKHFKPNFAGSDIEDLVGPESAINLMVKRLSAGARGKVPDAYDLHRVKKYIDENVTYGKSGEGLKGKTERILKELRSDVDSTLDAEFPKYDTVNTTYADTVNALDALQDVAGKKMDLFGPNADSATGTLLRRMMSNAQSRINLVDAVDNLDDISKKYGGTFTDDISTQMLFVDELDNVFGPTARTSLAGEVAKGFRKGAETVGGQRTGLGVALDVAEHGADKLRGINQENAFKSIAELLKR